MPSGHPMDKYSKKMVLNIYNWLVEEGPNVFTVSGLAADGLFLKIAKMTKLDQHTVSGIIREYENCGQLLDSKRQRPGRKKFCTVDLSTRAAVRNVIHSFYSRNESPTIEKIHSELRKDTSYKHCRSSTYKILMKSLGFVFKERNDRLYICKRPEIVARRQYYLPEIKRYR